MPALKWPHPLRWGKTVRGRPWRGVGSPWQTMEKTMAAWQMAIAHRNQNESWEADANPSQELPASRAGPKGDPGGLLKPSPMPRPTKAKIKTHTESQRPIDDFSDYSAKTCLENSNMLQNATECNRMQYKYIYIIQWRRGPCWKAFRIMVSERFQDTTNILRDTFDVFFSH